MLNKLKKLADLLRECATQPKRVWTRRPEILLLPTIPEPLYGVCPRTVLGQKWWDETRRAAYESTNFHCVACGVHKYLARVHAWLEGHEKYDTDYLLGRLIYIETVPLCHFCHCYIHTGRLAALLSRDKIPKTFYDSVIAHGDSVLHIAGLKKSVVNIGPYADWGDWRLVINDKEYSPKYPTREAWLKSEDAEL